MPSPKTSREKAEQARRRAEVMLAVRSGRMSVRKAAEQLGVSRKTYYEWEKRALQGMLGALEDRPSGRPTQPKPDPEKERLRRQVAELEKRLEMMAKVHDLRHMLEDLNQADSDPPAPRGKKHAGKPPTKSKTTKSRTNPPPPAASKKKP